MEIDFVSGKQGNGWLNRRDRLCNISPMGKTGLRYRQTNNHLSVKIEIKPFPTNKKRPGFHPVFQFN